MANPPRSLEQRTTDALAHLEHDIDVWVATTGPDGPYLVPLSLGWDGHAVVITTVADSRTVRNLRRSPVARLALGTTRDVVVIDASATITPVAEAAPDVVSHFVGRCGWDPADEQGDWVYVHFVPQRVQAWKEANEIAGRTIMRDGSWLS